MIALGLIKVAACLLYRKKLLMIFQISPSDANKSTVALAGIQTKFEPVQPVRQRNHFSRAGIGWLDWPVGMMLPGKHAVRSAVQFPVAAGLR
jgi:hypothetical protein